MRTPNSEQYKSINHQGGVLLNAGAGSGKTFVLVEHVYYLTKCFVDENKTLTDLELSKKLKSYLNKIVLMTFTNDAAGEIRNRVLKRFDSEDMERSTIVKNSLSSLTITTIHGFCMKLIKQGLIKAPLNMKLVDENQMREKIEKLALKWFETSDIEEEVILKNTPHITNAMFSIFTSPELRDEWTRKNTGDHFDETQYIREVFQLLDLSHFWDTHYDLTPIDEFSDKAWYNLLKGLNEIKKSSIEIDSIRKILDLFSSLGRIQVSKKAPPGYKEFTDEAKVVKDFFKKNYEDLMVYQTNLEAFKEWQAYLLDLFKYIEAHYYFSEECSFSDLEYLVFKDLQNDDVVDNISSQYNYFIVDEYQDTSWIQFDILKKITRNNFDKIFCVGDRKQAIYGFRGGELGVFNETEGKIPSNLYLSNNYRSEKEVIDFNNKFFEYIFGLGKNYEGEDSFSVKVDYQAFPSEKLSDGGEVVCVRREFQDDSKKKFAAPDYQEQDAQSILSIIEGLDTEVCVLYKNLKPSKRLISLLIEKEIPFQAQVKIPYSDDPVMIIFRTIIDYIIKTREDKTSQDRLDSYVNFYIDGVLRHYSYSQISEQKLDMLMKQLVIDSSMLGVFQAFIKFLYQIGISNSSSKNNIQRVMEICDTCSDDVDEIWSFLKTLSSKSYNTKFSYMNDPKVFIMTAHASKGLQFDNIILGGIHNNGRKIALKDVVGKLPASFRWSPNKNRKKLYKSPYYIYEQLLNDHKDFSESKRLLYVACTRAVKKIFWSDFVLNGKPQSDSKDSWVNALRLYNEGVTYKREEVSSGSSSDDLPSNSSPLYFIDNLGVRIQEEGTPLGIVSELSVTKLSLLALCPKKFYYSQILKLDEDIELFYKENNVDVSKRIGTSSADRGTRIHREIENYIKDLEVKVSDFETFDFVKELVDQQRLLKRDLISEREIKFSFFGQMVTGIPDLFISKGETVLEIWDFKTGECFEDDKVQYFYQLMTYAYGLSKIGYKINEKVKLLIVLIDSKKTILKEISLLELTNQLYQGWLGLTDLSTRKLDHCEICLYGNLCHKQ